jgi:hypothetical protein
VHFDEITEEDGGGWGTAQEVKGTANLANEKTDVWEDNIINKWYEEQGDEEHG